MFGANKTGSISRWNGSAYVQVVPSFRFRYQPNKSKEEKSYRLREDHIMYRLFTSETNVRSGDKVIESTGASWTVIGVDPYTDQLGAHIETTVRMRASDLHQAITIKHPVGVQLAYDPILHEYADPSSDQSYTDIQYTALLDENGKHKEKWVNIIGAGKYESISWVMTLEIDEPVELRDKVLLPDGELYLIEWAYTLPYQVFYGLKKTFKNTSYNG